MRKIEMDSPLGLLTLQGEEGFLMKISFGEVEDVRYEELEILLEAKRQLEEYFRGERFEFVLDLKLIGSHFSSQVWQEIAMIEYGKTKTYSEIARAINQPKSQRAVGAACRKNPIPIVIGCHRVIGKNNKLTGYAGGLENKKWLLKHEEKFRR